MSRKNFALNWVEHEKSFITSGPGYSQKQYLSSVSDTDREIPTQGWTEDAETRFTEFSELSVYQRVGISWSALETDVNYFSVLIVFHSSFNLFLTVYVA